MLERRYKCLKTNSYTKDNFELIPIRNEDKFDIMNWRNQQIDILRQSKLLTKETQTIYFEKVVAAIFQEENPEQLLFSFLENGVLIGYGGLVHINWIDRNAEISFLINTELEKSAFDLYWGTYLSLLFKVAFDELKLHKIYTYAFDLRPQLYKVLLQKGFKEEARLKEHCFYKEKYIDVLIHSKFN